MFGIKFLIPGILPVLYGNILD